MALLSASREHDLEAEAGLAGGIVAGEAVPRDQLDRLLDAGDLAGQPQGDQRRGAFPSGAGERRTQRRSGDGIGRC